jgi:glycerophosphoryl diester phosphodiesterase
MRRLLDWGVDAIISDRPDLAVAAVSGHPGV